MTPAQCYPVRYTERRSRRSDADHLEEEEILRRCALGALCLHVVVCHAVVVVYSCVTVYVLCYLCTYVCRLCSLIARKLSVVSVCFLTPVLLAALLACVPIPTSLVPRACSEVQARATKMLGFGCEDLPLWRLVDYSSRSSACHRQQQAETPYWTQEKPV